MSDSRAATAPRAIGYVLKGFPRLSELFIASEICRLERLGVPLRVFVIKRSDESIRHAIIDEIDARPEYLPEAGSVSGISLWRWLAQYAGAFAPSLWRVLRRHPLALLHAAALATAEAIRARRGLWPRKVYLKEFMQAAALADRLHSARDVTHLHAHFCHGATTVAWLAAVMAGRPFSFTAHAKDLYCPSLNPAGLLGRKIAAATFVVTCTDANRQHLQRIANGTPVHCVYHGLNAELARLLQTPAGRRPPDHRVLRVLGVGRLVRKKGFDVLVEALALLVERGIHFQAAIVGEDGDAGDELRRRIDARSLAGRVRLPGPLSQAALYEEYRNADVFCLPCRIDDDGDRDGIPNVLVEAMACGVPTVTTSVSGIPEVVDDGVTGLIVPVDDAPATADALERLRRDPALAQRIAANAARRGARALRRRSAGSGLGAFVQRGGRMSRSARSLSRPDRRVWLELMRTFGTDWWSHRRIVLTSYAFRMLAIGAMLVAPWPLKIIIDHVLSSRPLPPPLDLLFSDASPPRVVLAMTLAIVAIAVVRSVAEFLQTTSAARLRERLNVQIRDRMLAHLETLPPTIHTAHRSGELVMRLVGDVDLFVRLLTKTLPTLFEYIVATVATLALMFWLQPWLALISVALVPGLVALMRHFGGRLGAASREKRHREGEVAGLAQEIVRGLPVIQALGGGRQARARFRELNASSLQAGQQATRVAASMEGTLRIVHGVATALVVGVGALMVLYGYLTLGALLVMSAYLTQLLRPIERLNDLAETASKALVGGERLLALLDQQPAVRDAPDAVTLDGVRGVIELRDVWFSYASAGRRGYRAARRRPHTTSGPTDRPRRGQRRRKEHAPQPARAAVRSDRGHDSARRHSPHSHSDRLAPPADRDDGAGHAAVCRLHSAGGGTRRWLGRR